MGIIVDLFAGGGGASHGIYMATGRHPDAGVNHDPIAVAVHARNHPGTKHYCQDVWTVHPAWVTRGRDVDLLWASPDCTHHSKAKGAAPTRDERRRDLAMVIVDKWVPALKPRVIILENVEEFQDWGPLRDGKVVETAKGQKFREFLNRLRRHGYVVDYRQLRACDYGAPTMRNRLYLIARCDGRPIVWPEPTHGSPTSREVLNRERLPWRTAAECIDFSLPCPSIFATSQEIWEQLGIRARRPLKEATLRRIFRGLKKYVIENPEPFIIKNYTGVVGQDMHGPLGTVTTIDHHALVRPYLASYYGDKGGDGFRGRDVGEPLPTQTTENRFSLQVPFIQHVQHGGAKNGNRVGAMPADEPLRTITALPKGGGMALISPVVTSPAHSTSTGRAEYIYDPADPLRTITSTPTHAVACAYLAGAGGPVYAGKPADVSKPIGTLLPENHRALVTASMLNIHGKSEATSLAEPTRTLVTKEHFGLMTAHLTRDFGQSVGTSPDSPAPTVMCSGLGKTGLVTSHITKMRGTNIGQAQDEPLQTLTAGGKHFAEVRAFLMKYYGEGGQDQAVCRPLDTITSKARFGIVTVHGQDYAIVDIGMRMLQPKELLLANGFPASYDITRGVDGKPTTKEQQVRLIGNSVCPPVAAALVAANYVDSRIEEINTAGKHSAASAL